MMRASMSLSVVEVLLGSTGLSNGFVQGSGWTGLERVGFGGVALSTSALTCLADLVA